MKQILLVIAILSLTSASTLASNSAPHPEYPVHVMPGSPSQDYQIYLQHALLADTNANSSYVQQALAVGTRNLQWLDFLNAHRKDAIALTKPGELHSYPIDKPNSYSPASIEAEFKTLATTIPESLRKIIFENDNFTETLAIPVADYILWARKVDDLYQTAARWTSMTPSLAWYARNKVYDIRGYYFLNNEVDLNKKLNGWNQLPNAEQKKFYGYMVNLCENSSTSTAQCQSILNSSITGNDVWNYFAKYNPRSKAMFNEYFTLGGTRRELQWTSQNPNLAVLPFRKTDPKIENFLAVNIEDEWKWLGWQLKLDFTSNADVHVNFQAGVVPHVNGIAGNTIVMDKNASLNEWDVQWTIRHEFGHVLGFPDCYVEFYDSAAQQMINYQIDTTNLMCSRAGKFKQTHFEQMKSNYYK